MKRTTEATRNAPSLSLSLSLSFSFFSLSLPLSLSLSLSLLSYSTTYPFSRPHLSSAILVFFFYHDDLCLRNKQAGIRKRGRSEEASVRVDVAERVLGCLSLG